MKLQTQIPLRPADSQIDYHSRLVLLGSCFSNNMGKKFTYFKFQALQNPFGILFHPLAIEQLVVSAAQKHTYTLDELFFQNERWHCFDAHSDLSDLSKETLLRRLNSEVERTYEHLTTATHIFITLGTAWVYRHSGTKKIVANCHKVPQSAFSKELLSVPALVKSLNTTVQHIRSVNENAQLVFTVSPVRHLKEGFVENQRSKAHLVTAVHELLTAQEVSGGLLHYFPSYELLMDELRDYRFYTSDMVHPNGMAIDYIWERFCEVWLSEQATTIMHTVATIQKGIAHRPFNPTSEEHRKFRKALETKIRYLQEDYLFMVFERS